MVGVLEGVRRETDSLTLTACCHSARMLTGQYAKISGPMPTGRGDPFSWHRPMAARVARYYHRRLIPCCCRHGALDGSPDPIQGRGGFHIHDVKEQTPPGKPVASCGLSRDWEWWVLTGRARGLARCLRGLREGSVRVTRGRVVSACVVGGAPCGARLRHRGLRATAPKAFTGLRPDERNMGHI